MEQPKLHLRDVKPIGQKDHLDLCTGRAFAMDEYPESPTARLVRDLRVTLGIGLRDGAKALGLSAVELSSLERGSSELVDEAGGFREVVRRFILAGGRERRVQL